MKNISNLKYSLLTTFFAVFCLSVATAQVGIGTSTPDDSAILEVVSENNNTGVLLPRLTTAQRDAISSPAAGLFIFNTDLEEYQMNLGTPGTPNWGKIKSTVNSRPRSVKYSYNTSTPSPDYNAFLVAVPFFVTLEWNDDTALFTRDSDIDLTVNEDGKYKINLNIELQNSTATGTFNSLYFEITINGVFIGISSSSLLFDTNGTNDNPNTSVNYSDILDLNAGDTIRVLVSSDSGDAGALNLSGTNLSNIFLEKVE